RTARSREDSPPRCISLPFHGATRYRPGLTSLCLSRKYSPVVPGLESVVLRTAATARASGVAARSDAPGTLCYARTPYAYTPSVTRSSAPAAPSSAALSPRDRSVIVLLLISAFVVILNETILSVALPPIMDDLDLAETTAQWLTTGFMLTMAVVIPITGFLMGRFSTRQVFAIAMTTFTAGTLVCAVSPAFLPLLLGRIVQASGTAIMMPLLMTTVMNLVPPSRHGQVMGNISIVISV